MTAYFQEVIQLIKNEDFASSSTIKHQNLSVLIG